ncbi:efflux RND transporter periplasmic adaptor subunit [Candidatus Hydrogenosomobacter endosymbioticus]|uniref:MexH family multidrug efflux RND transporter periplasmic adaptor subunit n=1 Tax=Candidatus Hydrogenosomobacter endosymbioticus TaxID=2558174 RepID=A0ABN6L344_9PROT|nr:efflux RND transporter periplasmic adaptor subunit [Candidatus Hydrogenosomobacter endosymbioticus]BDB96258.1 MexH family multidrug efflux RND transporter periplasmic adaptor subunit [Candidatus Hydrogenosomobacter endosymbioticus]
MKGLRRFREKEGKGFSPSVVIGLIGVNIILLFFAWPSIQQTFPSLFAKKQEQLIKRTPPLVTVEPVRRASVSRRKMLSGTIKSTNSVSLMSEIPGKIKSIHFKEGAMVKEGHLLIQLDNRQAIAEVREAKARVKQLEAQYRRTKILTDRQYGSVATLEKAAADLEAAKAALEKAEVHLTYTQIRAPFDGYMGFKNIGPGDHNISTGTRISNNQELAVIVSPDPLEVNFTVPENEAHAIDVGQEIDVTVEGVNELPVSATVLAIEPYSSPSSHSVNVKAELRNQSNEFKPGMFARVNISLSSDSDSIVVPESAVVPEGDQKYVFVVMRGRAIQKSVILGASENGLVQVTHGLNEGDVAVIDGGGLLVDGQMVRTQEVSELLEKGAKDGSPASKNGGGSGSKKEEGKR